MKKTKEVQEKTRRRKRCELIKAYLAYAVVASEIFAFNKSSSSKTFSLIYPHTIRKQQ
jgi:hypothetical protein